MAVNTSPALRIKIFSPDDMTHTQASSSGENLGRFMGQSLGNREQISASPLRLRK
jgi:hypothetical protein